jgi:hypothetical protein
VERMQEWIWPISPHRVCGQVAHNPRLIKKFTSAAQTKECATKGNGSAIWQLPSHDQAKHSHPNPPSFARHV